MTFEQLMVCAVAAILLALIGAMEDRHGDRALFFLGAFIVAGYGLWVAYEVQP